MTVDLKVSQSTLDKGSEELASRVSQVVRMVPVPFEDGAVRGTALGAHKRNVAPQGSIRLATGDASLRGRIKEVDL